MDSAPVLAAFADAPTELLLVIPAGLAISAITFGTPLMVRFFKNLARR